MADQQQHIATYELEHRIWDALDALSTGTWTPDDLSMIRYATGLNYTPPIKETEHAEII
jgi:hypothetical protein